MQDKYLLSYHFINYVTANESSESGEPDQELVPFFMPLTSEDALQIYILDTVQQDKKLKFKLEKPTLEVLKDGEESKLSGRILTRGGKLVTKKRLQAKNEIEFSSNGQVLRDCLQVLQERPHY
jgi:hypothetical protein